MPISMIDGFEVQYAMPSLHDDKGLRTAKQEISRSDSFDISFEHSKRAREARVFLQPMNDVFSSVDEADGK
jgi:hypothetical protein